MARKAAKAADLASGLGAIVLGAGLALLAPERLRGLTIPILLAGIVVHGVGMTLKHRFEAEERETFWWEKALFWICWVLLGGLVAWLLVRLLTP
jgi:membrane-associated protease RseP (regulator of RpoE activity)